MLEHICNAIQPNLDLIRDRLTNRSYIYDLQTTPPDWLDWLQQFVGGAPVGDQWQGLGLNPKWSDAHKRRVLGRLWRYWQVKGTEWGIREAIALWLQFEAAHTDRLELRLPFGKTPTSTLPNWWSYDTTYDAHLYQLYPERQHLGSGDYLPGVLHQPDWLALQQPNWTWDYETVWSDRVLTAIQPEAVKSTSHLGPQRPWQHFYLETDQEWQKLLPDLYRLNPEIWSSFAVPTAFIWLVETIPTFKLEENQALPRQKTVIELTIDGFQYTDVFPFLARPESQTTQVTETVQEFWVEGCTYNDWWAGLGELPLADSGAMQPYPGTLWQVPLQTIVERVEAVVPVPAVPCIPGLLTDIVVGTETVLVGADPGTPASQLLEPVPGSTTVVETSPAVLGTVGFQWGDWWLSVQRTRIAPIDLSAFAPIDLSTFAPLAPIEGTVTIPFIPDLVQSEAAPLFGTELWYEVPAQPSTTETIVTPEGWRLVEPVQVATYDAVYGLGYGWYSAGTAPQAGTFETIPLTQLVPLCNVVDNWTRLEILIWNEYQVTLPEAELGYGLTDVYPLLANVLDGNQWTLLLETPEQIVMLRPITMLWAKDATLAERASYYSEEEGLTQLALEFIVQPQTTSTLRSLTLILDEKAIYSRQLDQLNYSPPGCFGFRFVLPVQAMAMTT